MILRSVYSWLLSLAPKATWIVAAILVCEALWIAQTFSSRDLLLPLVMLLFVIIAWRLRATAIERAAMASAQRPGGGRTLVQPTPTSQPRRLSRWLLVILVGLVMTGVVGFQRVSTYNEESVNYLMLVADVITHVAWLVSALLFIGYPRSGHPMMLPMGVIIAMVAIAAGGVSQTLNSQIAAALAFCIVFVAGSQTVASASKWLSHLFGSDTSDRRLLATPSQGLVGNASREPQSRVDPSESASGLKWLMSLAVLSLILTLTSTLARGTQEVLPNVQSLLHASLRDTLNSVTNHSPIGTGLYVDGSRFGSVRESLVSDPQGVALRAYADSAPGYLRGSAFDGFRDNRWLSIDLLDQYYDLGIQLGEFEHAVTPSETPAQQPKGYARRKLRHFDLEAAAKLAEPRPVVQSSAQPPKRIKTIEVHNDPTRGSIIFTPLSSEWIDALARRVVVTHHDIVLGSGLDVTQPYIAGASETADQRQLSSAMRRVLLMVSDSQVSVLDSILAQQLKGATTARQKANAISSYFQREYVYSLDSVRGNRLGDPIVRFLNTKHPAHCEYFATATALLLRRANVPTRYVTGYVADEFSEDEDCWLARNASAHAWVEAYDDATQTWFPVESTPGRSYHTIAFGAVAGQNQSGASAQNNADEQESRSLLRRIAGWWALLQSNDPLMTALRYSQLPLLIIIATLVWLRRRTIHHGVDDPLDIQSHKLLAKVDRRLRRHGLVREARETVHQFADRIERTGFVRPENYPPSAVAGWYRAYGNDRYQGRLPAPFEPTSGRGGSSGGVL